MRSEWYGDNRDLVKWSVLFHLAKGNGAKRILQIPFLCKKHEQWDKESKKKITIAGKHFDIPPAVCSHFRNILSIKDLQVTPKITVDVFNKNDWDTGRSRYVHAAKGFITNSRCAAPIVVFLDPDTGVATKGHQSPKHVTLDEVRDFWEALRPADTLVIYQHRFRNKRWQQIKQTALKKILSKPLLVAKGAKIAADVVFFYCIKGHMEESA